MEGKFDSVPQSCTGLKRIDLSGNRFSLTPTQLENAIRALGKLDTLHNLRVEGNPFCKVFPEYQIYFLRGLAVLTSLDGQKITPETRNEMVSTKLHSMSLFDDIYEDRLQEIQASETGQKEEVLVDFPCLKNLTGLMRSILADVSQAQSCSEKALFLCRTINEAADAYDRSCFFTEIAHIPEAIETFLQMIVVLLERHDTLRENLIQMLAR